MQDFKKLAVWQKSHTFTVNLYKITSNFPIEEKYGLTNQIRRASISIESNIAEGCGRNGNKELTRFLYIAKGSALEVECQILIARDLGYLSKEKSDLLESKINEIARMLTSLITKTRN
ncbi:MAG: four helix bundle protein [Pleurocapsa sp. CRU_1_2]|nr:four helix bundle protein [Pleurocapsa sp. CRU_1_2]